MSDLKKIKRALISVSDKTGIVEFAKSLTGLGIQLISTGGTAKTLRENGIDVSDVSEVTGFPEMMDGRVKTLHPKIHGAFLALRDNDEHIASMKQHDIEPIDLLVVNLYPFEETVARDDVTLKEAVENIDIGGPAMIRSASKNWRDVAVVTDSKLYPQIIEELDENDGSLSLMTRQRLATLAYTRTASYDLAISSYLANQLSDEDLEALEPFNPLGSLVFIENKEDTDETAGPEGLIKEIDLNLSKVTDLRYGENPHQRAALYQQGLLDGVAGALQLHGKEMSFNNYVDTQAAWELVQDISGTAVAIIKHTNPSGVGIGETNLEAYQRALSTDPVSAFGGIVAFNRVVDAATANAVIEVFSEVVIAPGFASDALEIFKTKKNLRVLQVSTGSINQSSLEFKQISGGFLVQDKDIHSLTDSDLQFVTKKRPTADEITGLLFAWTV
jgi:phosphoribosylaminoimidazolecarboxamide formyltransferase/IMP cyclohydrolase